MSPENQYDSEKKINGYTTKKCQECYTHLMLDAKECTACLAKVGNVDKLGFAEKPIDWWSYLIAVMSIAGFVVFMWWAFFRE